MTGRSVNLVEYALPWHPGVLKKVFPIKKNIDNMIPRLTMNSHCIFVVRNGWANNSRPYKSLADEHKTRKYLVKKTFFFWNTLYLKKSSLSNHSCLSEFCHCQQDQKTHRYGPCCKVWQTKSEGRGRSEWGRRTGGVGAQDGRSGVEDRRSGGGGRAEWGRRTGGVG